MRAVTDLFQIDGKPLLVPDQDVSFSYEDLDSYSAGRDEGGYMHRSVARYKVGSWTFSYSHLTEEERQYMERIFPAAPTFAFIHPDRVTGAPAVSTCYRSRYSLSWRNARTGIWSGYGFSIIEC